MKITAEFYSSEQIKYGKIYKKIVKMVYKNKSVRGINIEKRIIDLTNGNPKQSLRKQRSSSQHARTIKIYEDNNIQYIIGLTNTNYDDDYYGKKAYLGKKYKRNEKKYHTNTYLAQGITKIFNEYFSLKKDNPKLKLYFYLLDTNEENATYVNSLRNIISYRVLTTLGFPILNINDIVFDIYNHVSVAKLTKDNLNYKSFISFSNDLALSRSKNSGNVPSYLQIYNPKFNITSKADEDMNVDDADNKYIYVFKTLGAQAYDAMMNIWLLYLLAKKENKDITFTYVKETYSKGETKKVLQTVCSTLKDAGIVLPFVETDERLQRSEESLIVTAFNKKELRNQQLFRNNMMAKGMQYKCCLCDCEIPSLLDAAHLFGIKEVTDATDEEIDLLFKLIKTSITPINTKKNKITSRFYKRYMIANSGDNGIWLCKNHHKLFDANVISFTETGEAKSLTTTNGDTEFINSITTNRFLPKSVLNKKTSEFLKKHE